MGSKVHWLNTYLLIITKVEELYFDTEAGY